MQSLAAEDTKPSIAASENAKVAQTGATSTTKINDLNAANSSTAQPDAAGAASAGAQASTAAEYSVHLLLQEAAVLVRRTVEPYASCLVVLASPSLRADHERSTASCAEEEPDPPNMLPRGKMLDALAQLRHAKWFQVLLFARELHQYGVTLPRFLFGIGVRHIVNCRRRLRTSIRASWLCAFFATSVSECPLGAALTIGYYSLYILYSVYCIYNLYSTAFDSYYTKSRKYLYMYS